MGTADRRRLTELITGWRRIQLTSTSNCLTTSPSISDVRRFGSFTTRGGDLFGSGVSIFRGLKIDGTCLTTEFTNTYTLLFLFEIVIEHMLCYSIKTATPDVLGTASSCLVEDILCFACFFYLGTVCSVVSFCVFWCILILLFVSSLVVSTSTNDCLEAGKTHLQNELLYVQRDVKLHTHSINHSRRV